MLISKALCGTLLLSALAGCGGDTPSSPQSETEAASQARAGGKVECALAGLADFERTCSTEQIAANGATMLVIRHPDGGFRRFNVLNDGRGLAPSDGFDETRIRLLDGSLIELTSGDDKYRLPAEIKSSSETRQSLPAKDAS
jgi:hypothetical protein